MSTDTELRFSRREMRAHWRHGNRVGLALGFVYGVMFCVLVWTVLYGLR